MDNAESRVGFVSKQTADADLKQLNELFVEMVAESKASDDPELFDAMQWFKWLSEYNVSSGNKVLAMTVVNSYRYLAGDKCTDDGVRLAMILGWCVEWALAHFIVADDIMDNSVTRRGQLCWYKQDDVGLIAVNDAAYLQSIAYRLLRKYFRHLPCYTDLLELFHDVIDKTLIGQNLDLTAAPKDGVSFAKFTNERFSKIAHYKTAYFCFYLPVACAMYMNGISDAESHTNAQKILLQMGSLFTIQNDYFDCFGDPAVTGKVGTDIEENKCTWLIVQALARANDEQRAILEANYGRDDAECARKVKDVYRALQMPKVYSDNQRSSYDSLLAVIDECCGTLPPEMFRAFARKALNCQSIL